MKRIIIILTVLSIVCISNGYTQNKEVATIKYSNIGLPTLVKFDTLNSNYKLSESKKILKAYLKLSESDELSTNKLFIDCNGVKHERFQHFYKGLKVEFSEYTVHSKANKITLMHGKIKPVSSIKSIPDINEKQAIEYALKYVDAEKYMWEFEEMEDWLKKEKTDNLATYFPKAELVIWTDWKNETNKLAYKINVYAHTPSSYEYIYIDAATGVVIDVQQILKSIGVVGSADTRYSGNQNMITDSFTGGFRLRDPLRGGGIETMDMNRGTLISRAIDFVDNDNNWSIAEWNNANIDNAALDAHFAAQRTYDYFIQPFINRNGYDSNGGILRVYVHYSNNWNNGGWNTADNHIILGDGNGFIFNPLTDLDVIAHEFGHGISCNEVGLNTNSEPGAIDEGLSDIWAACVEEFAAIPGNDIWIMGEDYQIDANHRRNLQNPSSNHYHENGVATNPPIPYPDTYQGVGWYSGSWDFDGRHINCMVMSHWFFLLSQGGSGTNDNGDCFDVAGIGINNAAQIVYRMETVYLQSNSNFTDARNFAIEAAEDIFGANSNEVIQTTNAWYAVGIGDESIDVLSGSNIICSTNKTFTLHNSFPVGATVTWSHGANLSYVSGQGTLNYTVKAINSSVSGSSSITATITNNCGAKTIQKTVWVGKPSVPAVAYSGFVSEVALGGEKEVRITSSPGALSSTGDWRSYSCLDIIGDSTDVGSCIFYGETLGFGRAYVSTTNECGTGAERLINIFVSKTGNPNYPPSSISPNPASTSITIQLPTYAAEESSLSSKSITNAKSITSSILITNSIGNVVYIGKSAGDTAEISVSGWREGIYYVVITQGAEIYKDSFVVE